MKTSEEIIESHIGSKSWFGRENSPLRQEICKLMEEYASQFKPNWISIEHFMPEKETVVIASGGSMRDPRMVILRHGDFEEVGYGFTVYPSHWMPLPENPE